MVTCFSIIKLLPYSKISRNSKVIIRRCLTTNILVVGKKNGVESWISEGYNDYEKRIRPISSISTIFLKDDDDLINHCNTIKGYVIAMDENGKQMSSREFSDFYYKGLELGGSTVTFIIGGFNGLPKVIRDKYTLISLSKMTWTHQMTRLLLIEQIYRAVEIRKGSSYHKD